MAKELGLYIHIPFCRSKCPYCDFYSLTDYTGKDNKDKFIKRYIDALLLHMEDYSSSANPYVFDTVFIGGGTPTVVPRSNMLDLIDGIFENFNISPEAEFTIEANPATININMLRRYRNAGVNRISIGAQSACENELRALSRIHTFEDVEESFYIARRSGFSNINLDIMYGIPEQTRESLRETLEKAVALNPEHISFYGLKIEENTPFAQIEDNLMLPDEDDEVAMYIESVEFLERHGYKQYEISNFARDGFKCRHNLKYWNCEEYLGLGPSAHSYYNNARFSFKHDVEMYVEALEDTEHDFDLTDEYYEISPSERIGEYIMLRMRLNEGIDTEKFFEMFGLDFDKIFSEFFGEYIESGFVRKNGNSYSFTPNGMYISNYILSEMLDYNEQSLAKILIGTD